MLQVAEHQGWFCYDILDFIGAHYIRMDDVGLGKDNKAYDYQKYIKITWKASNAGPYNGMASKSYPASYDMEPRQRVVRMQNRDLESPSRL